MPRNLPRQKIQVLRYGLPSFPVTLPSMTNDASQLMAEALKVAKLDGSFSPAQIGARIGLNRPQAELAARALSNAGVLVLGFDSAAHFSPDFRKIHGAHARKNGRKK